MPRSRLVEMMHRLSLAQLGILWLLVPISAFGALLLIAQLLHRHVESEEWRYRDALSECLAAADSSVAFDSLEFAYRRAQLDLLDSLLFRESPTRLDSIARAKQVERQRLAALMTERSSGAVDTLFAKERRLGAERSHCEWNWDHRAYSDYAERMEERLRIAAVTVAFVVAISLLLISFLRLGSTTPRG